MIQVLTGNHSAAYAALLSDVEVVSAYPITPQTQIVEKIAEFVETGKLKAKYVRVESEHSAMAVCVGASSAGARTFTATSSHGLLHMSEMVYWASAARLPIVMPVVCRTLGPPWNIWNEHTDMLLLRDFGWIQFFAESNQEVLDTIIQAYRIAEDERVLIPVMVGLDAFTLSHTSEPVDVPEIESVRKFLPPRTNAPYVFDPSNPFTFGNLAYPSHHMEIKYMHHKAVEDARKVILEVDDEWNKIFCRKYGFLDKFMCEDAKVIILTIGSSAGDAKEAAKVLRKAGIAAGVLRIRVINPFPSKELSNILSNVEAVAVVDRNLSPGNGGILLEKIKSSLYSSKYRPFIKGYLAGLGGRDITVKDYIKIFEKTLEAYKKGETEWFNLNLEMTGS
ncbi:MAG: pyruvate ferredoxin oxidoreductase [Nitrososphaeria archaeon]|nr:pyruvate ferredoxin oxidoreductase [Nitrososphaeria archaeon]